MFLNRSLNNSVPSLANLAADALLQNPQQALKSYTDKDSFLQVYPLKISEFTSFDLSQLQAAIQKLELPEGVLIYTTGSDGKLEKSCRSESPIELIVVCDSKIKGVVAAKIDSLFKSKLLLIDRRIEYKDPKSDSLLICVTTNTFIPSRFLHNLRLIGSDQQMEELTLKFVSDIQQMTTGKHSDRSKFVDGFVVKHTNQMNKVISGKDSNDVDLAKGVISYSGMGRKATKYSLLRPIQYTLDLVLIDAIRSKAKTQAEYAQILRDMPRRVPEQIDYMREIGLLPRLSEEDVRDLKKAYTLGLFYFQTSQHLVSTRENGQVQFPISDKEELVKAYKDTQRILKILRK